MFTTNALVELLRDAVLELPLFEDGATNPLTIVLCTNNFTPSLNLAIGDVTLAATPGMGPKTVDDGGGMIYKVWDPASGQWGFKLREPVGGFNWVNSDVTIPPETIYGWILYELATTTVYASGKLDVPVLLDVPWVPVHVGAELGWLNQNGLADAPSV